MTDTEPVERAGHTPGPWRVGYGSLHVFADNAKIGGDAMVCEVRGWGYLTGKGHGALGLSSDEAAAIQDANARLIASAPDLLDALKTAKETIRAWHGPNAWEIYDRASPEMKVINAALLKAEGGPS